MSSLLQPSICCELLDSPFNAWGWILDFLRLGKSLACSSLHFAFCSTSSFEMVTCSPRYTIRISHQEATKSGIILPSLHSGKAVGLSSLARCIKPISGSLAAYRCCRWLHVRILFKKCVGSAPSCLMRWKYIFSRRRRRKPMASLPSSLSYHVFSVRSVLWKRTLPFEVFLSYLGEYEGRGIDGAISWRVDGTIAFAW